MRDYQIELEKRVAFLKSALEEAGATGFVFGNSGGKDSALVGILCQKAAANTLGLLLPCTARRGFEEDRRDALALSKAFHIQSATIDLTAVKTQFLECLAPVGPVEGMAAANMTPRLRMAALYAVAQSRGALVVGTGNRSEGYMGYFTKWGDGAYDLDPIADLTVTEIYEFLRFLGAPVEIIEKAPSAGLFEGQTDEGEMGVTYAAIDGYLLRGEGTPEDIERIEGAHRRTQHKRQPPLRYTDEQQEGRPW